MMISSSDVSNFKEANKLKTLLLSNEPDASDAFWVCWNESNTLDEFLVHKSLSLTGMGSSELESIRNFCDINEILMA